MKFNYLKNNQFREDIDGGERSLPLETPYVTCGTHGRSTGICATGFKAIKMRAEDCMNTIKLYISVDNGKRTTL